MDVVFSATGFLEKLISKADEAGASDIHIDAHEDRAVIRLRINGSLEITEQLSLHYLPELSSRIKVLARLRTDERTIPQDGRFRFSPPQGPPLDLRVAFTPSYHGEACVLRLLKDRLEAQNLESLGMNERDRLKILKTIRKSSGMILVTGPTGSGKTTTLYTILKLLNNSSQSIITIEDPIEYAIGGIRQIQVNPARDVTFANGLRSILRQDPDVIMVGEIRDHETAKIAIHAALTGHLVLSTLHTADAPTAISRLIDMGIEPYLVASTIDTIVSQRLVRTKDRKSRVGIYEVMQMSEPLQASVAAKEHIALIRNKARLLGMHTLHEDGLDKVKNGVTTLEEIAVAIGEE